MVARRKRFVRPNFRRPTFAGNIARRHRRVFELYRPNAKRVRVF